LVEQKHPDKAVALVTGANRGLGLEVSRQLGRSGYAVLSGCRNEKSAAEAEGKLRREGWDVTGLVLDVADSASIAAARQSVERSHGRLDVLVNNADIHYDHTQRPSNPDWRIAEEALATNTLGAWRVAVEFLPLLRRSAHGRIVNVSSESGSLARMSGTAPAYSMSKAALNAVTRLLAGELKGTGILVNSVCPGWTATDMGGKGGRPVSEGARSIVWAATLPDNGPTGGFFRDGKPLPW
jgi:NAD(P)-dependent dehydrogenase (short-subunit alcohol dehydrogenase family)